MSPLPNERSVSDCQSDAGASIKENATPSIKEHATAELLPSVQRGLRAVAKMIECEGETVADECVKAVVGEDMTRTWPLPGAGRYKLRISRESAFTAHCVGNVRVLRRDTGEILWDLIGFRTGADDVEHSFSIKTDKDCCIQMDIRAEHLASSIFAVGRSFARVSILHTASLIKGRFRHRASSKEQKALPVAQVSLPDTRMCLRCVPIATPTSVMKALIAGSKSKPLQDGYSMHR